MGDRKTYEPWTNGEVRWLKENFRRMTYGKLTEEHNRVFPEMKRTRESISHGIIRFGMRKRTPSRYTSEQEAFLIDQAGVSKRELGRRYRLKFKDPRANDALYQKQWKLIVGGLQDERI